VPGKKDFLPAKLIGDGDDVGDKFCQSVSCYAGRLATEIVATLVGDDDAKSRGRKRFDLTPPAIPKFREAVEKNDNRAVFGARSNSVQAHSAILE
jgi:hypothetical protein